MSVVNAKYFYVDLLIMYQVFLLVVILILPKGAVRDEGTFFIMLSILIILIGTAIILRRRRLKN